MEKDVDLRKRKRNTILSQLLKVQTFRKYTWIFIYEKKKYD